jgi:hypothetical protein
MRNGRFCGDRALRIGPARGDGVDAPLSTRKRMGERELGTLAAGDVQRDSSSLQLGKHRAFVNAFEDQTKSQRIGSTIF